MNFKIFKREINRVLSDEGLLHYFQRKFSEDSLILKGQQKTVIKYKNKKIVIALDEENGFVDKQIFYWKSWEKEIINRIISQLDKSKIFLDIGSNIGYHSLLASRFCKKVIAFEPIPKIYNQFSESISVNKIDNIELYNIALGDKQEVSKLHINTTNYGGSSINQNHGENYINIKIETLESLKINKFDVIKLDVEGYEPNVILGNKEIILKNRPTILLEFTPFLYNENGLFTSKKLFNFFLENNFSIYSIGSKKDINSFSEINLENQDDWYIQPY